MVTVQPSIEYFVPWSMRFVRPAPVVNSSPRLETDRLGVCGHATPAKQYGAGSMEVVGAFSDSHSAKGRAEARNPRLMTMKNLILMDRVMSPFDVQRCEREGGQKTIQRDSWPLNIARVARRPPVE